MKPAAIAAFPLGCCPAGERCLLCPPAPEPPAPATVTALAQATERDREGVESCWVGFYGGTPPSTELVEAAQGRPLAVRVRPDLLSRSTAEQLIAAGAKAIELDLLSLNNKVLRSSRRPYRRSLVLEMLDGLREMAVEVGAVLAPGLPGSTHETFLADVRDLLGRTHTARLHPVLVFRGSGLRELHMRGLYTPLSLGQAVGACREALDLLEQGGVKVIRIGQQPTPDGLGHAVAGPRHPSLRELVEARRALDQLRNLLSDAPAGAQIVVRCAPADLARAKGPRSQHVRTLRAEFRLSDLHVQPDPDLQRGHFALSEA